MNKFEIDVDRLMGLKMSVEAFTLLWCKRFGKEELLNKYIADCGKMTTDFLDRLINQEYIKAEKNSDGKYFLSTIFLTDKAIALFPEPNKPADWISQWFGCWPKGVKSGGSYISSDEKGCLKKMEKFCKDHPEYSKGIIIGATKKYLDSMRVKNYEYCKLAPYFISKDGVSVLDGYCADLLNSVGKASTTRIKGANQAI